MRHALLLALRHRDVLPAGAERRHWAQRSALHAADKLGPTPHRWAATLCSVTDLLRSLTQSSEKAHAKPTLQLEEPPAARASIDNNLLCPQIMEVIVSDVKRRPSDLGDLQLVPAWEEIASRKACQFPSTETTLRLIQDQRSVFILKLPEKT